MEYDEARWLTDLFNEKAPGCKPYEELTISMESNTGNPWTVKVYTPFEIATHLQFLRDTEASLLKRGTFFDMKSQKDIPNPITLECHGRYTDPVTRLTWHEEKFLRMRFMFNDQPSEMCLHGDFSREDRIIPVNKRTGPTLNQVINLMYSAGNDWSRINFIPPQLKPHHSKTSHLRLVKLD